MNKLYSNIWFNIINHMQLGLIHSYSYNFSDDSAFVIWICNLFIDNVYAQQFECSKFYSIIDFSISKIQKFCFLIFPQFHHSVVSILHLQQQINNSLSDQKKIASIEWSIILVSNKSSLPLVSKLFMTNLTIVDWGRFKELKN